MKFPKNSDAVLGWLSQIKPSDQRCAERILGALRFVPHDEFEMRLRELIIETANSGPSPVGLFIERELRTHNGVPQRLFKERSKKPRRAEGAAVWPVQPLGL